MPISKNELKRKLKLYRDGWVTAQHILSAADEYFQSPNAAKPDSVIIKFGMFLTGHDRETVMQMFNDFDK